MSLTLMDVATPGDRIDLARRRKGWTKTRLAKALGIEQPSVSAMIAGKFPGISRYEELAHLLGVTVEWITTGHPRQPWEDGMEDAPQRPRRAAAGVGQEGVEVLEAQIVELEQLVRELRAENRRQADQIRALQASPGTETGPASPRASR